MKDCSSRLQADFWSIIPETMTEEIHTSVYFPNPNGNSNRRDAKKVGFRNRSRYLFFLETGLSRNLEAERRVTAF